MPKQVRDKQPEPKEAKASTVKGRDLYPYPLRLPNAGECISWIKCKNNDKAD